jgi:hypothetical protein
MEPLFNNVKAEVLRQIQQLPDDCTIEDVQYRVDLLAALVAGDKAAQEGRVMTQEEAERRSAEWLASYGQTQP